MPVFRKIQAKARSNRGDGTEFFIKAFEDSYGQWESAIAALSDDDKAKIIAEFDAVDEGLGEALSGTIEEFKMFKSDCSEDTLADIAKKLEEYFECVPEPTEST